MRNLVKLALVVGLLALCACMSSRTDQTNQPVDARKVDCSAVRCAACPEGQTPRLKPPDCCRCMPVDPKVKDCSNVRCAACPEGQHPALMPPDCCHCVPD